MGSFEVGPQQTLENERPSAARLTACVITWATLTTNGKQTFGFKCYYSYLDELATDMLQKVMTLTTVRSEHSRQEGQHIFPPQ